MHKKDPLETSVAITLYYLRDQGSMQMTSNTFDIARYTVGQVIQEICGILTKNLGPEFIKFLVKKDEVLETVSQFQQRFVIPQFIGCIDGTHIPIKQPSENAHDYYSYKLCYTLNCQAICNVLGQFINVEVKWLVVSTTHVYLQTVTSKKGSQMKKLSFFIKNFVPGEECVPRFY